MAPVIGTRTVKSAKKRYRFTRSFFGKQYLQVGVTVQDWDTNSGRDEGPEYVIWHNADQLDVIRFFNLYNIKIEDE